MTMQKPTLNHHFSPGVALQRIIPAGMLALMSVMAAASLNDTRVASGDDLEERTERLTMIVDTLRYEYRGEEDDCFNLEYRLPASGGLVGFDHHYYDGLFHDCDDIFAFETRASADIGSLKQNGAKLVQQALLKFDERARGLQGKWMSADTCVGQILGIVRVDVVEGQPRPQTYDSGATQLVPVESDGAGLVHAVWDVTGLVRTWFTGSAENQGLLLAGHLQPGQFGEESQACVTQVTGLHLEVVVMSEPAPFDAVLLPSDLVVAPTPTRTPGPIERAQQDMDGAVLVQRVPTNTPAPTIQTKPNTSQIIRTGTLTPTSTSEPMVVPKPRSPFVQQ
jgi:hypothetical protein